MWLIERLQSNRCGLFKRVFTRTCPTFLSKQCYNARWTWNMKTWLISFLSTNCTLTDLSGMVTPLMNYSTFSASGRKEMSNRCTILVISRWSSNSAIRRPRYIRVPNPNEREAKASADSIKAVSVSQPSLRFKRFGIFRNTLISPHLVNKELNLSSAPRDLIAP